MFGKQAGRTFASMTDFFPQHVTQALVGLFGNLDQELEHHGQIYLVGSFVTDDTKAWEPGSAPDPADVGGMLRVSNNDSKVVSEDGEYPVIEDGWSIYSSGTNYMQNLAVEKTIARGWYGYTGEVQCVGEPDRWWSDNDYVRFPRYRLMFRAGICTGVFQMDDTLVGVNVVTDPAEPPEPDANTCANICTHLTDLTDGDTPFDLVIEFEGWGPEGDAQADWLNSTSFLVHQDKGSNDCLWFGPFKAFNPALHQTSANGDLNVQVEFGASTSRVTLSQAAGSSLGLTGFMDWEGSTSGDDIAKEACYKKLALDTAGTTVSPWTADNSNVTATISSVPSIKYPGNIDR